MKLTADYHTHTPYSHGKNTVEENALAAKRVGLKELGITDHGFAHTAYGMRRKDIGRLREEVTAAQEKTGVKILLGMEANLLGVSGKTDFKESDYENFDLFLCGYHLLAAPDKPSDLCQMLVRNCLKIKPSESILRRNTLTYINAIKNNPVDIVTHLSYRFPCDAVEVAKCASDYGTYIELNSKKEHLSDEVLSDILAKTDAFFLINSDAHSENRVGESTIVQAQLARINFPLERISNIDGRLPAFRFAEFKKTL